MFKIAQSQRHFPSANKKHFGERVFSFYGKYVLQGIRGYKGIDTEAEAFKNGSDNSNPNDYADQLLSYKNGEVMEIFKNGGLTNNQKASFLQSTGARFRRDVILKDRILYAKSRLANISKEMSKINKISAGIQKFYNRYINYYNNEVKNSEDEQDEITKKYRY